MKMFTLITLILAATLAAAKWKRAEYEDFVKKHNGKKLSWTAQLSDDLSYDDDVLKSQLGLLPESDSRALLGVNDAQESLWPTNPRLLQTTPPAMVDLRTQYPQCAGTISLVRNQSQCGSCWAFATATSTADRYCIKKGTTLSFSYNDLLTCCPNCAGVAGDGCQGGYLSSAFAYIVSTGLTTGELYGDNTKCKPYFLSPSTTKTAKAPACSSSCVSSTVSKTKTKISSYKKISGEAAMINELATGGSIAAAIDVYQDFYTYKTGVYVQTSTSYLGGHAVRLIGYGEENGVKYWLAANSWGSNWGIAGFFKIRRGQNECKIESNASYAAVIA